MGTMGYGLPAGIAAALEFPQQRVVTIAGDGGVQSKRLGPRHGSGWPPQEAISSPAPADPAAVTIGELATAIQHKCNLTLVILNNRMLGRVHFGFGQVFGDQIVAPDFVALAKAYGGDGMHVNRPEDVQKALEGSINHDGVYVIEIAVDPELKAEYARMRDEGAFLVQLRQQLADLLPAELRPSDIRKLTAFDVDGDGMLSADELQAARKVLSTMHAGVEPTEFLRKLRTGQLYKSPVLTSVKQVLQPLSPSPFHFIPGPDADSEAAGAEVHVIGAVSDVLNAHVPEGLRTKCFPATPYQAGFELGAIGSVESLGEMCLKDGKVFVRSTDESSDDFFRTQSGDEFYTSAAVLVPKDVTPNYRAELRERTAPEGVPFVRTVNDLFTTVKGPFIFAGEVDWHKCDVTCISRAPVHEDMIGKHLDRYYWHPGSVFHNLRSFVCGAVARSEYPSSDLSEEIFTRIFYRDLKPQVPAEDTSTAHAQAQVSGNLYCHVHLITYTGYSPTSKLDQVWHVNPNSIVKSMDLSLFRIKSMRIIDE